MLEPIWWINNLLKICESSQVHFFFGTIARTLCAVLRLRLDKVTVWFQCPDLLLLRLYQFTNSFLRALTAEIKIQSAVIPLLFNIDLKFDLFHLIPSTVIQSETLLLHPHPFSRSPNHFTAVIYGYLSFFSKYEFLGESHFLYFCINCGHFKLEYKRL